MNMNMNKNMIGVMETHYNIKLNIVSHTYKYTFQLILQVILQLTIATNNSWIIKLVKFAVWTMETIGIEYSFFVCLLRWSPEEGGNKRGGCLQIGGTLSMVTLKMIQRMGNYPAAHGCQKASQPARQPTRKWFTGQLRAVN